MDGWTDEKLAVARVTGPERFIKIHDCAVSGCGKLCLHVRPGVRSGWVIRYRLTGGGVCFCTTLGHFPDIGLDEARALASEEFKHIASMRRDARRALQRTKPKRPAMTMNTCPKLVDINLHDKPIDDLIWGGG